MSEKYWSIKEVSELYNINSNKLRFYEKKGLITPKRNIDNGYRQYDEDDLAKIQLILTYRLLEVPVEKIGMILTSQDKEAVIKQVLEQLDMLNAVMHKYKTLQSTLREVVDIYQDNDSKSDVLNSVISAGKKIGSTIGYVESWEDRWDFDSWAEDYDVRISRSATDGLDLFKSYDKVLDRVFILSKEGLKDNGSVLDIGAGIGKLASKYIEEGIAITALDQSHEMLLKAKSTNPKLTIRVGDFLKLPFESNAFDRVVTTYALHHLDEDEKVYALGEMLRVLKDDGMIIIGDMMFKDYEHRNEFLKKLDKKDVKAVEDEYYTNIKSFGDVINKNSLLYSVEQIDEIIHILKIIRM